MTTEESATHVTVRVRNMDNHSVTFRLKRSAQLRKLTAAYSSRIGKDRDALRFLYNGVRIYDDNTPVRDIVTF